MGLCPRGHPCTEGLEVTLSLFALSPCLLLLLSSLPLWHQCPTRWYWKLVPVSGAVSLPRLPVPLVTLSVCLFLPACLHLLLPPPGCEQRRWDLNPGVQRGPLCEPREGGKSSLFREGRPLPINLTG